MKLRVTNLMLPDSMQARHEQVSIWWGEARVFFEPSANYEEPELHHEEYVHVDANGAILRKGAP